MKLSYRKRAKDQILFFRANWDSRNFWVLVRFWGIFQLQVALKNFLWVIWWYPRYLKGCPRLRLSSAHRIMTVITTDQSFFIDKSFNPPPTLLLVLDHASLNLKIEFCEMLHPAWSKTSIRVRQRPNLVFQSQLRLSKFLSFGPFLGHFSTSGGSKKFSMGDMRMFKVFKRLL